MLLTHVYVITFGKQERLNISYLLSWRSENEDIKTWNVKSVKRNQVSTYVSSGERVKLKISMEK